jgi:hypothetical protein
MVDALRSLMTPPALVMLAGVVAAVAAFARLFRRPGSNHTSARSERRPPAARAIGSTHSDPFDASRYPRDDERGDTS